nr:hypothetical protein [Tanacetum cinerariifolium]
MVAESIVPYLIDKKGGSYVAIAPKLEPGKYNKWKKCMLCYLAGMEPYHIKCIKDGPFQPKTIEVTGYSLVSKGFQPKFFPKLIQFSQSSSSQADLKVQKDYKAEYKNMKAKLALFEVSPSTYQNLKAFQLKNKGLISKTFYWDEEEVSNDEEVTRVKVLMALVDDELYVGKNHACNGECIDVTMGKVNILLSMDEDADWQNYHVYINIDLKFVKEQILMGKVNILLSMDEDSDWQNYHVYINIDLKIPYSFTSPENSSGSFTKLIGIAPNEPDIPHTKDAEGHPDLINTEGTHEQIIHDEQIITQSTKGPFRKNTEVSVSIIESSVQDVPQSHISNQASTSSHHVPQDRWSKDQHIELLNSIGDPGEGMLTRSMATKLTATSASECLFADFLFEIEPKKVSKALKHPRWVDAMQKELNRCYRNKVWTLVPLPHRITTIGSKWVFKNKKDEHGITIKNKARLVVQGYSQEEEIDYDETFTPVCTDIAYDPNPPTDDSEARALKEYLIKFLVMNGKKPLILNYKTFVESTRLDHAKGTHVSHPFPKAVKVKLEKIIENPILLARTYVLKTTFPMAWRILFTFVVQDPSKVIPIELTAFMVVSQGPKASGLLPQKRKKLKSKKRPTKTKGTRKSQLLLDATTTDPKDSRGKNQPADKELPSMVSNKGMVKTTPLPEGPLEDKDSEGNKRPADMKTVNPTITDLSGTGAKYQVDKVESDTKPLQLKTFANVQSFLLFEDEMAQESNDEEVFNVGEDMDKDTQADKEEHQSPLNTNKPEPSLAQET